MSEDDYAKNLTTLMHIVMVNQADVEALVQYVSQQPGFDREQWEQLCDAQRLRTFAETEGRLGVPSEILKVLLAKTQSPRLS